MKSKKIAFATIWSFIDQIVMQLILLFSNILLIRLLKPEDFGIYITPFIIFSFAKTFQDLGTIKTLYLDKIYQPKLMKELFGLNIISTSIIGSFLVFLAPHFVKYWTGSDTSFQIMFWLGISYFFTIPQLIYENKMKKQLEFKKLFRINLYITIISTIIGLLSALIYGDYWALFNKHLSYIVSGALLFTFLNKEKILPSFDFYIIKKNRLFSFYMTGNEILGFLSRNIDNLLIGGYLGTHILGIYERAYRFLKLPNEQITGAIGRILLPVYSEFQNNRDKQFRLLIMASQFLLLFVFPISAIMVVYAKEFVSFMFGSLWLELIPLLKIFGVLIIFQCISPLFEGVFISYGKSKLLMTFSLISNPIYISTFIYFTLIIPDIYSLSLAYTITSIILSLFYWQMGCKLLNQNVFEFLKKLKYQLLIAISLFTIFYFYKYYFTYNLNFVVILFILLLYFFISIFSLTGLKSMLIQVFKNTPE